MAAWRDPFWNYDHQNVPEVVQHRLTELAAAGKDHPSWKAGRALVLLWPHVGRAREQDNLLAAIVSGELPCSAKYRRVVQADTAALRAFRDRAMERAVNQFGAELSDVALVAGLSVDEVIDVVAQTASLKVNHQYRSQGRGDSRSDDLGL